MKYVDTLVSFSEVPDEISLCISISNCPYHCPGCHSSYLAQDIGEALTPKIVNQLVKQNSGISCICFMGGTESEILGLLQTVDLQHRNLKIAWYTGQKDLPKQSTLLYLDYIKIGPYVDELGPLTSKTTNQRFYRVEHLPVPSFDGENIKDIQIALISDITSKFWENNAL